MKTSKLLLKRQQARKGHRNRFVNQQKYFKTYDIMQKVKKADVLCKRIVFGTVYFLKNSSGL